MIPDLQESILLILLKLGEDTTVNDIKKSISEKSGKDHSFGSMFTSVDRLADKKYVEYRQGEPTPQRGGRSPRLYTITVEGKKALVQSIKEKEEKYRKIIQDKDLEGLISTT